MNWYYAKNGAQQGPVALEDMKSRIAMGEIAPTDLAWREGMADWMPVSSIAELKVEAPPARQEAEPAPGGPSYAPAPAPAATSAPVEPYRSPVAAPAPAASQLAPGQVPSQGLAIASMICGIVALVICCAWYLACVLGLVAVVLGFVALGKIKGDPVRYRGKGMAITGIITGILGLIGAGFFGYFTLQLQGKSPEEVQETIINWMPESMRDEMRKEFEKQNSRGGSKPAP
jgi:hypothetical protein